MRARWARRALASGLALSRTAPTAESPSGLSAPRSSHGVPSATWSVIVRIERRMSQSAIELIATMRMMRSGMPRNHCNAVLRGLGRARRRRHHARLHRPVRSAANCSCSTDSPMLRDSDRPPCPTPVSRRSRIGRVARVAVRGGLQCRGELARVQRVDARVALEHREQRGRVVGAVEHAVVRRVREQPARARSGRPRPRTPRSR